MIGDSISSNPSKRGVPRRASSPQSPAPTVKQEGSPEHIFVHPLSWWRTRQPNSFTKADLQIMRNLLKRLAIIGEPHWHLGAAGDWAVAIGVAVRALESRSNSSISLDAAMTAVLCIALEGSEEATLLVAGVLKHRSEINPPCSSLSDLWLIYEPGRFPKSRRLSGLFHEAAGPVAIHRSSRNP